MTDHQLTLLWIDAWHKKDILSGLPEYTEVAQDLLGFVALSLRAHEGAALGNLYVFSRSEAKLITLAAGGRWGPAEANKCEFRQTPEPWNIRIVSVVDEEAETDVENSAREAPYIEMQDAQGIETQATTEGAERGLEWLERLVVVYN